ncbi:hypothetical protein Bbelb_114810 [Branchiostoma belcheri]|nr:hypothetical protein Bbelb_114810 [Branchiostoma belcheri]
MAATPSDGSAEPGGASASVAAPRKSTRPAGIQNRPLPPLPVDDVEEMQDEDHSNHGETGSPPRDLDGQAPEVPPHRSEQPPTPPPRRSGSGRGNRLSTPDGLRGNRLSTPDGIRGNRLSIPDGLRGNRLSTPDGLRGNRLSIPDGLRGNRLSTPDGLRGNRLSTPDGLRGNRLSTPDRAMEEGQMAATQEYTPLSRDARSAPPDPSIPRPGGTTTTDGDRPVAAGGAHVYENGDEFSQGIGPPLSHDAPPVPSSPRPAREDDGSAGGQADSPNQPQGHKIGGMSGLEPGTLSSESRTLPIRHTTPFASVAICTYEKALTY